MTTPTTERPAEQQRYPRLLFLTHLLPWPLHGGGQIVSHGFLSHLAKTHDVTLLSFIRDDAARAHVGEHLAPHCAGGVRLIRLPRGRLRDVRAFARSFVRNASFLIERDDSAAMHFAVAELLAANRYDLLVADHLQMMAFVPKYTHGARLLLNQHNAETLLYERLAGLPTLNPLARFLLRHETEKLRRFEMNSCHRADAIQTLSQEDANALAGLSPTIAPAKISVVPMERYVPRWPRVRRDGAIDSRELLFVGTLDWPPNRDALLWFCGDVLPIVRRAVPDVVLTIVGARADRTARRLGALPNVRFVGFAQDLTPFVAKSSALVVPLRAGGGVRVKIVTARWMGLPVVSTPLGAEGLGTTDDVANSNEDLPVVVAEANPSVFANACIRMLLPRTGPTPGWNEKEMIT